MKKTKLKQSRTDSPITTIEETKQRFLVTLRKKLGIISLACALESVDEQVCRDWVRNDPAFARQVEACREAALDFVEARMFERIDKGDARLIRFYLETRGKDRGYVLRHEVSDVSMPQVVLTPEEALMLPQNQANETVLSPNQNLSSQTQLDDTTLPARSDLS
ncbi:MAG: hypothetical protein PHQ75_04475 [Thermoguttaceae bacterium]|nr:hypothetical protein [Thermoguttaceae bacterium]